ncbi:MAG: B12-binding domain-containing radical SAM protein [Candidatus Heimdallarchaeaceae archaeon]
MLIKEKNAIKKEWNGDKVRIALLYPITYRTAMTSLGMHLLYFLFNSWENVLCERVFKPIGEGVIPYSLESQKPLRSFDIIAISLQFEADYIEAIKMVDASGISPDVRKRKIEDPLIIAGGPSITANPFPILFFADAYFIGDLEPVADSFRLAISLNSKKDRLAALADVQGMMVYGYHYDCKGNWLDGIIKGVKIRNFTKSFYPIRQIIPQNVAGTKNEPVFGNAYYLEISRGCSERCNFCLIGNCRFPRTDRTTNELISIVEQAQEVNDFDRVVLYGSSIDPHINIEDLLDYIVSNGFEVSLPSIRADTVTERLLKLLRKGKQRVITFAPETGDENLRFAIHKQMDDQTIFEASHLAWESGFRNLKLYMMYGFPQEKQETYNNTISFIKKIRMDYFPSGKISVSMNQMITKASTPFQFAPMMPLKASKEKQKLYRHDIFSMKGMGISFLTPEWCAIQRILSLRGHSYFDIILKVPKIGNTVGSWKKILKSNQISLQEELTWNYEVDDELPWDNLSHFLQKKHFIKAYEKYCQYIQQ